MALRLTAWLPDEAFPLVQAGLLNGKSISFIPTKVRYPTDEEREKNPALKKVFRIIEEWLLLEYACCYLQCNQQAVVEAVSKGLFTPSIRKALNIELPAPEPIAPVVPFTPMEEVEKAVARRLRCIDADALAQKILRGGSDRATGKV